MLKCENCEATGWEHAIRGMRNPKNSWDKRDSYYCLGPVCPDDAQLNLCKDQCRFYKTSDCPGTECTFAPYIVGPNDLDLMMKLRNAGIDHRKFMRMITVYVDITAPLYWWKEFDTYKVGTVANSCSTMHTIHKKEFTLEDFSCEKLFTWDDQADNMVPDSQGINISSIEVMSDYIIPILNASRKAFLETNDKRYWENMIQLLPTSYNQKRTVMLNYEVLANIYKSRKNHKLTEWHTLCNFIESLPYSELITGGNENG